MDNLHHSPEGKLQEQHNFPMKCFIDLFAGCGGLSLGLMQAGWQGLFAVERDAFAFETLCHNLIDGHPLSRFRYEWPEWLPKQNHEIGAFIRKYKGQLKQLRGKIDLIAGGPPCQGFSMAGRRRKADPRNQLFQRYIDVVKLVRPRFLVIENVPGISVGFTEENAAQAKENKHSSEVAAEAEENKPSSTVAAQAEENKPFSKVIEESLDRLRPGYKVFGEVVRASDFGVPQLRPRFIIIGIRKDVWKSLQNDGGENALRPHHILGALRQSFATEKGLTTPVSCFDAIGDLENLGSRESAESQGFRELVYVPPVTPSPFVRLLRTGMEQQAPNSLRLANHKVSTIERWTAILADNTIRRGVKLNAADRRRFGIEAKHSFAVLAPHQPSHTLTTLPDDLLHYSKPRILTVREYARLQAFPDWFDIRGKYTTGGDLRTQQAPRYTQVGNAVPPLLAEAIGRMLMSLSERLTNNTNHTCAISSPAAGQFSRQGSGREMQSETSNCASLRSDGVKVLPAENLIGSAASR